MHKAVFGGILVGALALAGCAADLSSGKKFEGFATPPAGKSLVYMIRDENIMALKLPYIYVKSSKPDGEGKPVENYLIRAVVGKSMFVPVLMDPGTYLFKTAAHDDKVTLKPDELTCLEVGGKYRGVTIFTVEQIADKEECRKMLEGKYEGVQVVEALRRTGQLRDNTPVTTADTSGQVK